MTDNKNDLGKTLKLRRVTMSLTLAELAERSGVSSSHLGRIERGERFPSGRILRKLTKPLGFEETELLTLAGYLSSQPHTEPGGGRLEPYVAGMLAQEPVDMQRAVIGILSILKSLARSQTKE